MLQKLEDWIEAHRDVAFDLLRIYLGVGLLGRGVLFIVAPATFVELVEASPGAWLASPALLYFTAFVHLVGGAMMAAGFLTRLAALAQIPILAGAVFVVHFQGGLVTSSQSFEFSTLVLFLLVLIFIYGSGEWSVDARRQHRLRFFQQLDAWAETHHDAPFALLRIYLGMGLFARGVLFIANSSAFIELLGPSSGAWLTSVVVIHYVALAHLFGGVLMILGLLTRLAALIQIPILIGAVFVALPQGGLLTSSQSFEFSTLVLFLLVLVFLYGSGRWSLDHYVFVQAEEPEPEPFHSAERPSARRAPEEYAAGATEPVLTAPRPVQTKPALTCPRYETCPVVERGEEAREHPWVSVRARYSVWGAFYFLAGITGPPKEIVYTCDRCGQTIDRSRSREDLERYRYRS